MLNGKTYISSGSGGILLTSAPDFPIDSIIYNNLLYEASLASGSYSNTALSFDGRGLYIYPKF